MAVHQVLSVQQDTHLGHTARHEADHGCQAHQYALLPGRALHRKANHTPNSYTAVWLWSLRGASHCLDPCELEGLLTVLITHWVTASIVDMPRDRVELSRYRN